MGIVLQHGRSLGLVRDYAEETVSWRAALIEPGRDTAQVKAGQLSTGEVETLLLKLDQLALSAQHEGVAKMVAEELASIILAVRMVKAETKASFSGILGSGSNLDIRWLHPRDVGGILLNPAATAALGLYRGTIAAVYTWLHSFVANTSAAIIPSQIMANDAGVIHLGAIDPVEVPKLNLIRFTLAGIAAPTQGMAFNIRNTLDGASVPFVRFEKPIIVGTERTQVIDVVPNITGESKFQLLSFLIAKAEDMVLT